MGLLPVDRGAGQGIRRIIRPEWPMLLSSSTLQVCHFRLALSYRPSHFMLVRKWGIEAQSGASTRGGKTCQLGQME